MRAAYPPLGFDQFLSPNTPFPENKNLQLVPAIDPGKAEGGGGKRSGDGSSLHPLRAAPSAPNRTRACHSRTRTCHSRTRTCHSRTRTCHSKTSTARSRTPTAASETLSASSEKLSCSSENSSCRSENSSCLSETLSLGVETLSCRSERLMFRDLAKFGPFQPFSSDPPLSVPRTHSHSEHSGKKTF